MKRKLLVVALAILSSAFASMAQNFAVKTNLLYDATATINVGAEIGIAPRWTGNISGNYNAWDNPYGQGFYKHASIQPEIRFWFCDRMAGHFIGLHGHGGAYNFGLIPNNLKFLGNDFSSLTDYRYQGYFGGGGLTYGYAWAVAEHLNIEFELGVGYAYTEYDKFECYECGRKLAEAVPYHYIGPTKLGINLVYVF